MKARENPFRSERIEGLAFRPAGFSLDGLMERLAVLGGRGAIVGAEGSGKTTLLEALASHLQERGVEVRLLRMRFEDWNPRCGAFPGDTVGGVLLVDGLESAGHRARSLLQEMEARRDLLIISSHRPGLLPTLVELRPSQELFTELVRELVGEEDAAVLEPDLPRLFQKNRGNLRECFRELYDRVGQT
jgi:hypothetical protein